MTSTGPRVERQLSVEFFVEPFTEGAPGPHVSAAVQALEARGLAVEIGAFSSTATGDATTLAEAISDLVEAAVAAGAERIQLQVTRAG